MERTNYTARPGDGTKLFYRNDTIVAVLPVDIPFVESRDS